MIPRAEQEQGILEHLEMIAKVENFRHPFASLVLLYGSFHRSAPLPSGFDAGARKQCFANAQRAVMSGISLHGEPLYYAEGYACSGTLRFLMPTLHAWLVTEDGTVVDPTWPDPETSTYFGVVFQDAYVLSEMNVSQEFTSMTESRRNALKIVTDEEFRSSALRLSPELRIESQPQRRLAGF